MFLKTRFQIFQKHSVYRIEWIKREETKGSDDYFTGSAPAVNFAESSYERGAGRGAALATSRCERCFYGSGCKIGLPLLIAEY